MPTRPPRRGHPRPSRTPPPCRGGRPRRRWPLALILTLAATSRATADDAPAFDARIAPILARRCLDCHSGPGPKGGLDLSRRGAALAGGDSGEAIVPGRPEESLLWSHVVDGIMPPKARLPEDEAAALRDWIAAGAPWGSDPIDRFRFTTATRAGRDWWSLQPVARPPMPRASGVEGPSNPIDAFLGARHAAAGLRPSPPADRRTLIRRLSYDLLGLPPSPEEVEAFVGDESPDAYERLVDRLLASPQFGVRRARLWLDLARFGESHGFEHDEFRPDAWRYRDWVVDAFNRDLPYDEFARLQIAGDAMRPDDPSAVAATGFLVAGAFDSVGQGQQSQAMRRVVREDEMEDLVGTVAQTFLGLTVHCARCHDHKFDPIPQSDYYRIASALSGVRHGERAVPLADRDEAGAVGPPRVRLYYAVVPRPPDPTHRLVRGDPAQPAEVVTPGGVSTLAGLDPEFGLDADAPEAARRLRLVAWLTDPRNPLFARVMVNRLWQWHFGAGLVETPSDFGFNGGVPSHPELLDWLASELLARGGSLKAIHRLIVTSAAYRRSSRADPESLRIDAGNRLLWRKAPMRLEAEMVRDAMLAASGALVPSLGGPGFREFAITRAEGTITHRYTPAPPDGPGLDRRTLYRTWARGGRSPFLDAFDCPDPSTVAPRRASTTTPLQALVLLHNAQSLRLASRFADRLRREAGDDPTHQVDLAYRLAFGRPPDAEERAEAAAVVAHHGPEALARAIFNSAEFFYVD